MKIKVNDKLRNTQELLSAEVLSNRVYELAQEINSSYPQDENLTVLIVLHGSLIFAADLVRHLTMPTEITTIDLKSYISDSSNGMKSSNNIKVLSKLPETIRDKNILIVEDIVDTGRTLKFLIALLTEHGVKSINTCTLLNKPSEHIEPIAPKFVGFDIGNVFVLGYGLDLNGKYRNLPHILELI